MTYGKVSNMIATITMRDGTVKEYDIPNIMHLDVCPNMALNHANPAVSFTLTIDGKVESLSPWTVGN